MSLNDSSRAWWSLIGVSLVALAVGVDFSIVNTCLANIQYELSASVNQLQWVIVGFGLLFCTLLVAAGKLADMFGHRKLLIMSLIGFGLASLGAGLSQTPTQLIAWRVLQGLFSAPVFPCGTGIVAQAFSAERRGQILGIYGSIIGIGLAVGPVIGGFIVSMASWRWIFFINLPVMMISLLICLFVVEETRSLKQESIDYWGVILLTLGLGTLTFSITQGSQYGWFSWIIVSSLVIAVSALFALIKVEKKIAQPFLPLYLFTNVKFIVGSIVGTVGIGLSWLILFVMPLYLHNVLGKGPRAVGLFLLPMTLMVVLLPSFAGRLFDKKGALWASMLMFALVIVGLSLMLLLGVQMNAWILFSAFIAFGIGWAVSNGTSIPIALSGLKDESELGVVSGAAMTIFNIAGILSVALGGMLLQHVEKVVVWRSLAAHHIALSVAQAHAVRSALSDPESLHQILRHVFSAKQVGQLLQFFREGFVQGLHAGIWMLLLTAVLFLMVVIFKLRRQ